MLRFTKSLEISYRKKLSRFSTDLWKGLAYALAFHAALLAIFRVASLPNLDVLHPLFPVNVEIDLGRQEILAELPEAQMIDSSWVKLEPPSTTHLDGAFFETGHLFYSKKKSACFPDFSELEKLPYLPVEAFPGESDD